MRFISKKQENLEENIKRVELCVRTGFSARKGIGSPTEIVKKAKELGIGALAICDDYSTSGYTEFYKACQNAQIDAIYGVTIVVDTARIVVLAKNKNGILAINKIISESTPKEANQYYKNKYEDLLEHKEDIITIFLYNKHLEELLNTSRQYDYIGVAPDCDIDFENETKNISKFIAVSDSYYPNKSDKFLCDALVRNNVKGYRHLRSGGELLNQFPHQVVFENPIKLIESIEDDAFYGWSTNYYCPKPISESRFRAIVTKEISKNIVFKKNNYKERLEFELEGVIKSGFWPIFYIAYETTKSLKKKGEYVGARGTVSSSLLAYALGISSIDPIKWDLPYQTFIGFDCEKLPIIELSTSLEANAFVFDILEKIVGDNNVLKAGSENLCTFRDSSKLVLEYLSVNDDYYDNLEDIKIFRLNNTSLGIEPTPSDYFLKSDGVDFHSLTPIKYVDGIPVSRTDFRYLRDTFSKIGIMPYSEVTLLRELEKTTGVKIDDIPLDDPIVLSLLTGRNSLIKNDLLSVQYNPFECIAELGSDFVADLIRITKPKSVEDLIKISGFAHGTGVWNENGEQLINRGHQLQDLIANRDDVYNILVYKYDLDEQFAFMIMENVRKGRGLKEADVEVLRKHNVSEFLIKSMDKIKYAFPRAHSVQYVIYALKQAYFKVHYPIDFYNAYFNIKYDKELVKSIRDASEQELFLKLVDEGKSAIEAKLIKNIFEMNARGYDFKKGIDEIVVEEVME